MKLRLSDYSNIADIIGGIAVVVTLVFLIQSINENTAVSRWNSQNEIYSDINDWFLSIANNPELSHFVEAYRAEDITELTDDEKSRLYILLRAMWRNYEKSYFAFEYGVLGGAEYGRFNTSYCGHWSRQVALGIWPDVNNGFTSDFLAYIEHECGAED